jgi:hypothetical protein
MTLSRNAPNPAVSGRKPPEFDSVPVRPDLPFVDALTAQFAAPAKLAEPRGLNSGTDTIGAFRVRSDSLTPFPFVEGLPAGANGLAAR